MIAVLMPTRNKPEEVLRIAKELEPDSHQVHLYIYFAFNDPKYKEYVELMESGALPDYVKPFRGHELGFSRGVNHLADKALAVEGNQYKLLLRCEDDFYFTTPGWSDKYLEKLPNDGIAMIWCNYVLKGPDAEPHTAAISVNWYKTLGWFSLPTVKHYYCDNVLKDLAEFIHRSYYIPEPLIEHRHVASDPRKCGHGPIVYEQDRVKYVFWKQHVLPINTQSLFKAMD